ncbi:MAG: NAD(P)/FAD-dependent oxidoreductase [Ktedonobacterales bacterium]|nr:NAD(P)/FAD-dependent oxidoreductase [Ktedonobacterales bacterium]
MPEIYDVAIVGAGPAGSASAIHLARAGWRVVLVDRGTFPRHKPCAEYLSPAAEPLLRDLGVLAELASTDPGRLRGFRIYAPDGTYFQGDFAATKAPDGGSLYETGLSIARYHLDDTLVRAARAAGVEVREGWRMAQIVPDATTGGHTLVPAVGNDSITARLVIAADGLHSTIAKRLGLQRESRMRKIALVAHLRGIAGLTGYGEMHVANRRYVGLAPFGDGDLCNVAMVVDEGRDAKKLAGHPQDFLLASLATFPKLADRLAAVTVERQTLAVSHLAVGVTRLSTAGVLLAGDAAGYYDPFTGEGIYKALHGAGIVARVATAALRANDTSAATLARYDRELRADFRGKRIIEMIIQASVQVPPLMNHISWVMRRRKHMADTIVAVTGDFLSPWAVLNPGYLLRLVV